MTRAMSPRTRTTMRQGTAACSSEAVGEATTEAGSTMVATTGTVGTVMAVVTVAAVEGRPAAVVMEAVDTAELHAPFPGQRRRFQVECKSL